MRGSSGTGFGDELIVSRVLLACDRNAQGHHQRPRSPWSSKRDGGRSDPGCHRPPEPLETVRPRGVLPRRGQATARPPPARPGDPQLDDLERVKGTSLTLDMIREMGARRQVGGTP